MYAVNQAWLFNAGLGTFFVEGIYFTLLYILGSMFMLNLTLAVIWEEFENEHERMEEDEAMLISEELKILQRQGYTVQDQTEGEAMAQGAPRSGARAELTGDPCLILGQRPSASFGMVCAEHSSMVWALHHFAYYCQHSHDGS